MSFDWREFVRLAERTRGQGATLPEKEAADRSAASRAYYGAFHVALEDAVSTGYARFRSGDDHTHVEKHLRECRETNKNRWAAAKELNRLKDLRNKADYDNLLDRKPESLAVQAITMAKRVLALLGSTTSSDEAGAQSIKTSP